MINDMMTLPKRAYLGLSRNVFKFGSEDSEKKGSVEQ